jgi:histone acetyltransferase (RNA polymerase elongator complex component)
MRELLDTVSRYVHRGLFFSVRVSTRPDAIDEERLDIMKKKGVRTVELGAQSMHDRVLELSRRGHKAEDTVVAVHTLRRHGLKVGIQLMPGLPGDSKGRFRSTVTEVIRLRPDVVRLYPAIVLRGTALAHLHKQGEYRPLDLEEALEWCTESCMRFEDEGIAVIRIGLMSSPSLLEKGEIIAGPWHAAFGSLVREAMHMRKIAPLLPPPGQASYFQIRAPAREISLVRGYKNRCLRLIESKIKGKVIRVLADENVSPGSIEVDQL